MNAASHLRDGDTAEQRALDYLLDRGLKLLSRNYRCYAGELDLVMQDGVTLAVVEVRFRRNKKFGGAAASIDLRKQKKLRAATLHYLSRHAQGDHPPVRFDVIAVEDDASDGCIDWIRNAFDTREY